MMPLTLFIPPYSMESSPHAIITPLLKKEKKSVISIHLFPSQTFHSWEKYLKKFYTNNYIHLSNINLFDVYQSDFRVNHSTETALIRVVNDLKISSDNYKASSLMHRELSAAFDTLDQIILLQ